MIRRLAVAVVLLGAAGVALWLAVGSRTFGWHQRLTVTVATPAGEVSGSSVTEVVVKSLPKTLPDAGVVDAKLRGEAVVVEVAPGKYLFALLNDGLGWTEAAYDKNRVGSVFEENMRFIEDQSGQPPVPLPRAEWPLMVTFDDVADPKTARMVDPDNLEATFGPGVELRAVTLEVTGDPVTDGRVEQVLGWLIEAGRERANVVPKPDGLLKPRTTSELTPEERLGLDYFLSGDHWGAGRSD
jgi:hypothetical protein